MIWDMPIQVLEQLFDSPVKLRLLKLFLRNPHDIFKISEIAKRIQANLRVVRRQVEGLKKIAFLKRKTIRKKAKDRKPGIYFSVNPQFDFYPELKTLVLKSSPASLKKIFKQIKKLGRIRLAILSGVFLNLENSRIDLFMVGDNISKRRLDNFLKYLEAEVGKSIDWSLLSTEEFNYRYEMFDRFILDILEKPHQKLINRLRI